ncbi:hypothetical protein EJI00_02065 [Variovorax sp. DXTD-1]|nr:hypothetical protein EJI00_02065 [Variovorax sp. DXTD-1]
MLPSCRSETGVLRHQSLSNCRSTNGRMPPCL